MINVNYIHECDEDYLIEKEYQDNLSFIESCSSEMALITSKIEQSKMFESSRLDNEEVIMEGVGNLITKLGNKIIDIIKKCTDFVNRGIQKIKEFIWKHKDQEKFIRKVKQDDPELASRIQVMVNKDKLSIHQFKDVSDFYKNIDDCLKELEKGDAKTAKAKALKAKDIFDNASTFIVGLGTLVTTVTGAVIGIDKVIKIVQSRHPDKIATTAHDRYSRIHGNITRMTVNCGSQSYTIEAAKDSATPEETMQVLTHITNITSNVTQKIVKMSVSTKSNVMQLADRVAGMCKKGGDKK